MKNYIDRFEAIRHLSYKLDKILNNTSLNETVNFNSYEIENLYNTYQKFLTENEKTDMLHLIHILGKKESDSVNPTENNSVHHKLLKLIEIASK